MKNIFPTFLLISGLLTSLSSAAIVNLTNVTIDGEAAATDGVGNINGAYFQQTGKVNSGSGGFRDLYRVKAKGTESGKD